MDQILSWAPYALVAVVLLIPLYVISRMAGTVEARMWSAYDAAHKRELRVAQNQTAHIPPPAKAKNAKILAESMTEHTADERWQQVVSYNRAKRLCRLGMVVLAVIIVVSLAIMLLPSWASLALTIVGAAVCALAAYAATRPLRRGTEAPEAITTT